MSASAPQPIPVARPGGGDIDPLRPFHHLIHGGYTVLVTRPDGSLGGAGREGLYDYDTRILSLWRLTLDGRAPQPVSSCIIESDRWGACLRVPLAGGRAAGPRLPQDALEVDVARRVGSGMAERITVANRSMEATAVKLALALDGDFADVQEVQGRREQRGRTRAGWDEGERALAIEYAVRRGGRALRRGIRVRVVAADTAPAASAGARRRLRFRLELPPRGIWTVRLAYESLVDGAWRCPPPLDPPPDDSRERERARCHARRMRVEAANPVVEQACERAAEDLVALRNWELDAAASGRAESEPSGHEVPPGEPAGHAGSAEAWVPNAGVPTYTGFFGRDALTAGWQGALLGPEMLRGAIHLLAATQATEDSPFHDAEPGKMLHEMRRGPLAELEIIPQRAYYGTQTSASMFVVTLAELWHWTGEDAILGRHRAAARAALDWARRHGDADGDGFLETVKRSPRGLKNQGWKDSDEAIRYPDGRLVENPLATVEEQAFHLLALQRLAEIAVALGDEGEADALLEYERELRRRWHAAFWMPEEGCYAMALDRDKRQVRSLGSNPLHVLAAGVVPPECARPLADRLLAPDLWSGWGVRTLSREHPSYNPFAYHLGAVWPVESGTFALGCKRYGLDEHLERVAAGLFATAGHCHRLRLPEALGGHGCDETPVPTLYPRANSPQAWSASAVLLVLQALLGLYPFAPAKALALVRPRLPEWLPEVTLRGVRVGEAEVSLRFTRRADGGADHEVLERRGTLHIVAAPPPDDLAPEREGWRERLASWAIDHAPGRTGRALRIAMGETG
jgi:glycogen debranching enzyme